MLPPIANLKEISQRLTAAGIEHALGGSGLLHFLGMPVVVGDWDLTVDAPQKRLLEALDGYSHEFIASSAPFRSQYLCRIWLAGSTADVIGGFAVETPEGVERIRTIVTGEHEGIPLGSAAEWLKAYRVLNKQEKVAWIVDYLVSKDNLLEG